MADEIKLGADFSKVVSEAQKVDKALDGIGQSATQSKDAIEDTYEVMAGAGANYAQVEKATERAIQSAVAHTQSQKAVLAATEDLPLAFQRNTALLTKNGQALDDAAKKNSRFGNAVQTTAFAVQDFTSVIGTQGLGRAIGSVQNNIPTLITQMGGAAGLAGAVSIVSIGAGLLYDNWDKLTKKFGEGLPAVPKLQDDLSNLKSVIASVNDDIEALEKKAKTDALSHPELKRLDALKAAQSDTAEAAADNGLVEGIKSSTGDKYKELTDRVKQAIATAGGGEAVAGDLAYQMGAPYKEGVARLADVLRGATNAEVESLAKLSPVFRKAWDALEEDLDKQAQALFDKQQNEWQIKFDAYEKEVKDQNDKRNESVREAVEEWRDLVHSLTVEEEKIVEKAADVAWEGLRKLNEDLAREAEKDQLAEEKDARDHPGQDIIRDVEYQNFGTTRTDKYGRQTTTPGLALSTDQVKAAADAAREFQQTMGYDDRTSAQLAIQELIVRNQQGMADRFGRADARLTNLMQQAGSVPSIYEWGW